MGKQKSSLQASINPSNLTSKWFSRVIRTSLRLEVFYENFQSTITLPWFHFISEKLSLNLGIFQKVKISPHADHSYFVHFHAGVPIGVFAGYIISAWVFFGSMFYPPNTNPGVRSVRECPFYQQVLNASRFGNGSNATLDKYGDGLIRNPYKPHSTPIADLYGLSYLWLSGLSFGAATIVSVFASFVLETKQDQLKKVDHMLLFPIKAWLRGFLPGHKFTWEEENDANDEDENEMKVKSYFTVRANNL
ncbi:uncharacterized protein LOC144632378 [Oculina patagonica]